MKKYNFIIGTILLAVFACKKEKVDIDAPLFEIIEPTIEQVYQVNDTIKLRCAFTDNEELKSYKVDLHFAEGHTHSDKSAPVNSEGHPWTYEKAWDFESGLKESDINQSEIIIPDSVVGHEGLLEPILHGEYHFGIFCTDVAGNQSHQYIGIDID